MNILLKTPKQALESNMLLTQLGHRHEVLGLDLFFFNNLY